MHAYYVPTMLGTEHALEKKTQTVYSCLHYKNRDPHIYKNN